MLLLRRYTERWPQCGSSGIHARVGYRSGSIMPGNRFRRAVPGVLTTRVIERPDPLRFGAGPDGRPATPVAAIPRGAGQTPGCAMRSPHSWAEASLEARWPLSRHRPTPCQNAVMMLKQGQQQIFHQHFPATTQV